MADFEDTETGKEGVEKFGYNEDAAPPRGALWDTWGKGDTGWDDSKNQFDHLDATNTTLQAILALYESDGIDAHGAPETLVQTAFTHFNCFAEQALGRIRDLEAQLKRRPRAV